MWKRKQIAKMLTVILTLQIILPVLSIIFESGITLRSIAAGEISSGDWKYTVNEDGNTITIIEYSGTEENIVIPSDINGYTVAGLGNGRLVNAQHTSYSVFEYGYVIETIKLPATLTTIGSFAFWGCSNIINIELNEGLQTIGNQAFYSCKKIENIVIPSTVMKIANGYDLNSFSGCNALTSITVDIDNQYYCSIDGVLFNKNKTILIAYPSDKKDIDYSIPESVNQIYGQAINNPNIQNLYISKYINNMEGEMKLGKYTNISAILGCTNLQNITVDELNEEFCSEDGILYNVDKSALLLYPSGKQDNYYNIPTTVTTCATINNPYIETIKINTLIDDADFLVNMPNLKNIEVDSANANYTQKNGVLFNKNGNKIVYYPQGRNEETYTIDENVTEIQSKAFINSKIIEISLPDNVTVLGNYAFYNCKNLKHITLSNNLISIGNYAFYNCNYLTSITIPNAVTSIGDYAFYNCRDLTSVIIPNSVISIGKQAFYNCTNIKELLFEETSKIEKIGDKAFSNCLSLEEVNIPEGITTISGIFDNCNNLKIINIPKSVESFSVYSIYNNGVSTYPQVITINNENPTMNGTWIFSNPDYGYTVIRCYSTATNVINWTKSLGYIHYNIIDLDKEDEKFLYEINDNNEVTITDYIGDEENIEIPSQIEGYPVTSLGKCIGTYNNLTIPSTVKNIGTIYSSNLENINVDIENQYFTSKEGVLFDKDENQLLYYPMGRKESSYNIPEGTTSIGGTTRVTIGSIYYQPFAFGGNLYLESLNIPKSISNIGSNTLDMINLSEISVDAENSNYVSKDNILYKINDKEVEIEEVPTKIKGEVELLYGLTKINTDEFEYLGNLEAIVIPTTVTNISHNAFYCCNNLKKLVISPSTTGLTEINSGNLSFGRVECEDFKVYCEDKSTTQKFAKKWGIDYEIIEVEKIEIKQNPEKTSYLKDKEMLNLDGGLITITYDDGTALDLSMTSDLLNITGFDNASIGNKQIEVDYKGHKANFYVNVVEKILTEIAITTPPSKTTYIAGQNFDSTGMAVTATYNDGTSKEVTNYTITDGNNLTVGQTSVTISYKENGITKTTIQNITVTEKESLDIDLGEYKEEQQGEEIYIKNILPSTSIREILNKIKTNGTIEIYKGTEKITNLDTKIGTGMTVKIILNQEQIEYTVVIKGDINGDGNVKLSDLSKLKLSLIGTTTLEGAYKYAADLNGDGSVKLSDLSKMKLYLVGKGDL